MVQVMVQVTESPCLPDDPTMRSSAFIVLCYSYTKRHVFLVDVRRQYHRTICCECDDDADYNVYPQRVSHGRRRPEVSSVLRTLHEQNCVQTHVRKLPRCQCTLEDTPTSKY